MTDVGEFTNDIYTMPLEDLSSLDDLLIKKIASRARIEAKQVTRDSAVQLVKCYYDLQSVRIGMGNRVASEGERSWVSDYIHSELSVVERHIKSVLDAWTDSLVITSWAKSVTGIGPVLAAGLHAHIDITKAKTHGAVWRYAGLDPSSVWGKGQKRPFNASLKVLAWKIGESFIKVSGNDKSLYGKLYREKKQELESSNDAGHFTEYARKFIEEGKDSVTGKKVPGTGTIARQALESGRLPQAQIHARARRFAVKIFLSHYHEAEYQNHYHTPAPLPYALAHLDHAHKIEPEVPYPV